MKIVGETFPWGPKSKFRYLRENHNSVLGMREYALLNGGTFKAVDEKSVEQWLKDEGDLLVQGPFSEGMPVHSLFAYPAEDNFAGNRSAEGCRVDIDSLWRLSWLGRYLGSI